MRRFLFGFGFKICCKEGRESPLEMDSYYHLLGYNVENKF